MSEPFEDRCNRLEVAVEDLIRQCERITTRKWEYKRDKGDYILVVRAVHGEETTAMERAVEMARVALGIDDSKGVGFKKDPALMSDEQLCEHFASTYRIHSNLGIYNRLKAGHDEILKRLKKNEEERSTLSKA